MSPFDLQVYGSFQTVKKILFMFKPIVAESKSVIEESKKRAIFLLIEEH